jgi:ABC-type Fe3+ transport system substrate-binding protein
LRSWPRLAVSAAGLCVAASAEPAAAQQQVTVYCSILEQQCREGVAIFERSNPGTKVSMVRKSTGEAYAQIKAEATNPRANVWWGGPAEPHLQAGEEGLLESYLKINSIPSNKSSTVAPEAPRLGEIKLIGYDTAKYGAATERRRLLGKWTQEVQSLPR